MMATASMRMLMILLFAAAVVNFTNYAFCWLYSSPSHRARAHFLSKIKRSRSMPLTKSMVWTAKLVCDNQTSPGLNQAVDEPNDGDADDYPPRAMTSHVFEYFVNGNKNLCPEVPSNLGPEKTMENGDGSILDKLKLHLRRGGIYKPTDCITRHSVAIIVPCRGCQGILNTFLQNLHPILMKQQLDYQIFVVEQSNASHSFERGKLLNLGYLEAQHYRPHGWRCVIFHEPYVVPVDSRNLYRCSWYPRQLATLVERIDRSSYLPKFGGAIAILPEQFVKANGFSNLYLGSDGEYLNMYKRLIAANLTIERTPQSVGKYRSLKEYEIPFISMKMFSTTNMVDGLTTLSYSVDAIDYKRTHTHIDVNFDVSGTEPSSWEKIRNQITSKLISSTDTNTRANT